MIKVASQSEKKIVEPAEIIQIEHCSAPIPVTKSCEAGTTNDLSVQLGIGAGISAGAEFTIDASVQSTLGVGRSKGESVTLPLPRVGYISEYKVETTTTVSTGQIVAESNQGDEQDASYTFNTTCSIEVIPINEYVCEIKDTSLFVLNRNDTKEIFLQNDQDSTVINLTKHPANDFNPKLSPDQLNVAFISDRDTTQELYVIDRFGTEAKKLTSIGKEVVDHEWSPNGDLIAIQVHGVDKSLGSFSSLYIVDLNGNLVELATFPTFLLHDISWSPRGTHISIEEWDDVGNMSLNIIEVGSKTKTTVVTDESEIFDDNSANIANIGSIWLPNNTIIVTKGAKAQVAIFTLNPFSEKILIDDNQIKELINTEVKYVNVFKPKLSSDQSKIFFYCNYVADNKIFSALFVYDIYSEEVYQTIKPIHGHISHAMWNPSQNKIVLSLEDFADPNIGSILDAKENVFIVNSDGSNLTQLTDISDPYFDATPQKWLQDNNTLRIKVSAGPDFDKGYNEPTAEKTHYNLSMRTLELEEVISLSDFRGNFTKYRD